jgi:hypothetical protein
VGGFGSGRHGGSECPTSHVELRPDGLSASEGRRTPVEDSIEALDPVETRLVADRGHCFERARFLAIEDLAEIEAQEPFQLA